jgi:hypothetical protein
MKLRTRRYSPSLEEQAAAPGSRKILSPASFVLCAAAAILAGRAAAEGNVQAAILAVGALTTLAIFRYLDLPLWCSLILVSAVATRGLTGVLGLPELLNFIHYPLVALFALAAADRPLRPASRPPGRWIRFFLLVVLLSAVAHPGNPLRTLLFVLIAGEPLVVIWAISRWGADSTTLRATGAVAIGLAAIQLPIGLYQGLTLGWTDPVQGTLSGHGAGHHVLGALFALAMFIVIAAVLSRRLNVVLGGLACAVCLAMMLATGSMTVLVVATLAAFVEPLIGPSRPLRIVATRRLSAILLSLLLGASALAFVAATVPGFYERAERLATSRQPSGVDILSEHVVSDPLAAILGSGPGTTASRASLLLIDPREGSPLKFIGVEPTQLGLDLFAATSDQLYGGSVESAASSILGVAGDLGLVGVAALAMLFLGMWKRTGRSRSWLAPAGRAALLMVGALSLIDNWLEYPEFAIPFAILMGFVLSDARE